MALTNALEQDGFIQGFMGFYVKMVGQSFPSQSFQLHFSFICPHASSLPIFVYLKRHREEEEDLWLLIGY